jgi:addiction module HigA family antidote
MATEPLAWQPDWAVSPGEILLETLQDRGMSQSELARRMGRPTKTINEIVNGKTALTPATAIQLELTLGIAATFWNKLEANYREYVARESSERAFEASAAWAERFPITDLVRNRLIERGPTKGRTVASLLSYFGVGSPIAWENQWLAAAASFRASPAFTSSPEAVASWLRWGEILAADVECAPFDGQRLRDVVDDIRALTRHADFMQTIAEIQGLLASAGVVLLLTPEFTGTHLSGVARWITSDRAVVQLSMRHKSNDHFWFSLFHELGHLILHKRADFLDAIGEAGSANQREHEADGFARDCLVGPAAYSAFVADGIFSESSVREFAKRERIAPGILIGRLQRDGHVADSQLNYLKRPIRWARPSQ